MKYVNLEIENRVGYITINRPEKRNALNFEVVSELKEVFSEAENSNDCKVIVLRANGKVFCAGADLEYLQQLQNNSYDENLEDSRHLMEFFKMVYNSDKIVIGQIHGHAIAGGCGLATVCDFSFTVPEAKFGYTEVKIGFIPAIVMVFLIRKIGEGKAKELLLTGDLLSAEDAVNCGLINKVIDGNLEEYVKEFALKLCGQNSGESMALTKKMIGKVQNMNLDEGLNYAAAMNASARDSKDCKAGIGAFLNKEKLTW